MGLTHHFEQTDAVADAIASELVDGIPNLHDVDALLNTRLRMTVREGRQWLSLLLLASRYLEWGAGGTTVIASWRALQQHMPLLHVEVVDSSRAFWNELKSQHAIISLAGRASKLSFHLGDIGKTEAWGRPVDWMKRAESLRTAQALSYVNASGGLRCCYDMIMVDGRFREACAINALSYSHERTVLVVHDAHRYVGNRSKLDAKYFTAQNTLGLFYDEVIRVDTLAVFRPRARYVHLARASAGGLQLESALRYRLHDYNR